MNHTYTPVVIIGAPRSGTNMLRDVLARHPEIATWPCDEINYIWRHGNRDYPTDEIPADRADDRICSFINREFDWVKRREPAARFVLEKTCANALRVPFVHRVVPNALYIQIIRDGRDVLYSAMDRWTGEIGLRYLLQKARFVPRTDLAHYAMRFAWDRIHRPFSRERRARVWGPRFTGMNEVLADAGLPGVCAAQWAACVSSATNALDALAERVLTIRYESFTHDPHCELARIAEFLKVDAHDSWRHTTDVSTRSIGRWRNQAARAELAVAMPYLEPLLESLGYE